MKNWDKIEIEKEIKKYLEIADNHYKRNFTQRKIPSIIINGRLTRALGRVCFLNGKPSSIEFSKKLFEKYNDNFISNVIGHETAHYISFLLSGKIEGHNQRFKNICNIINVQFDSSTITDIEKYIKDDYCENERKTPVKEKDIRYVIKCNHCNVKDFRKVARSNSIENWLSRICPIHGNDLSVYDLKEKKVYTKQNNKIIIAVMSSEKYLEIKSLIKK